MALSNVNNSEMKQQLENTDQQLRQEYLEVVKSLELEELRQFNKMRFRNQMAMLTSLNSIRNCDKKDIDIYAQCTCISNYLSNEAQSLKSAEMQMKTRKLTRRSRQKGPNSNDENKCNPGSIISCNPSVTSNK